MHWKWFPKKWGTLDQRSRRLIYDEFETFHHTANPWCSWFLWVLGLHEYPLIWPCHMERGEMGFSRDRLVDF